MPLQSSQGGQEDINEKKINGESKSSFLIRAIEGSSRPKLVSINNLLRAVVQSARTVVKGTVSQRRFNAQYTEFCRAALVGMADLEDAIFELEKENVSTHQHEIRGIGENGFIKELAAYISSQTDVLGLQYLEHVGLAAISSTKMKQKTTEHKTNKRVRGDDSRIQGSEYRNYSRNNMDVSPSIVPVLELEESLLPVAPRGGTKLSSIPSFTPWIMPWTIPVPNAHGVALDRVTTERPKNDEISKQYEGISVIDICNTTTSAELLRLWEGREIAFSSGACRNDGLCPSFAGEKILPSEEKKPMFFPRTKSRVQACVPSQVITDLVHCGINLLVTYPKDSK